MYAQGQGGQSSLTSSLQTLTMFLAIFVSACLAKGGKDEPSELERYCIFFKKYLAKEPRLSDPLILGISFAGHLPVANRHPKKLFSSNDWGHCKLFINYNKHYPPHGPDSCAGLHCVSQSQVPSR